MPRLKAEVIKTRLEFAQSVNWDHIACATEWQICRYNAKCFIQAHQPPEKEKRPEYENQRLFDLLVMETNQWCEAWGIPRWEYKSFLRMYERQRGEKLPTPERRAKWEKEYWEKLG